MTRETFEGELHRLKDDVVQMGVRAGQAISRAVEALRTRDVALAEQVVAADDAIDAMHLELERRCMRLLATQQPMAGDLRTIASVFAITMTWSAWPIMRRVSPGQPSALVWSPW